MNYQHKTKKELIEEICSLSRKITQLENEQQKRGNLYSIYQRKTISGNPIFPLGTWELNVKKGEFVACRSLYKVLGLNDKYKIQTLNDFLTSVFHEDQQQLRQTFEQAINNTESFESIVRSPKSNGKQIYTLIKGEPVFKGKKLSKIVGSILDLSILTNHQDKIFNEEDRYHTLFELLPVGILLEDDQGTILHVNQAFCRFLGYNSEELIGEKVHLLAHPDVRDQVNKNISQLLAGKVLKHNEKSVRKDGTICYMELNETKVSLSNGKEGILCIAEDYTERVKAQEEHILKEKLQGILEMAGAVCHELNQPLTTIFITSDLVLDFPLRENIKENITVIKDEAIRIGQISEKLMNITKYKTRDYINGNKIFDLDKASEKKKKSKSK